MFPSKSVVDYLKTVHPAGQRVALVKMDDAQAPAVGTLGTVTFADDAGTVFIAWDNGSNLGAVWGEDLIKIV